MDSLDQAGTEPILVMTIGGTILGIDPRTGDVSWAHELSAVQAPTALVVTATRIFACNPPRLVCLEYPTGAKRWSASVARGSCPTILLVGELLYVSSALGHLECFTVEGQPLWHTPLKGRGTGGVALGMPGNVMQADYWR